MNYTYKTWDYNQYYDFYIEFNRIESYNEYCKEWLSYFGKEVTFTSKTNWEIQDIPDISDYNRIKININLILEAIETNEKELTLSRQTNQVWNVEKANELEDKLRIYLQWLGDFQFAYNVTGLSTTGNELKLGGV